LGAGGREFESRRPDQPPPFGLRLGEPEFEERRSRHSLKGGGGLVEHMIYVYVLQSLAVPDRFYEGITENLRARLKKHNAGQVSHTSKYVPWKIKNYIAFEDRAKAYAFEKYLKSGSGRAFAKKHL
jgi:putative endonuclease